MVPGKLPENVARFARLLRAAGLPAGPGHTIAAVRALAAVDIADRTQFYWALHATLVSKREHRRIFDSAFRLFWRDPFGADEALSALLSASTVPGTKPSSRAPARLSPPPAAAPSDVRQGAGRRDDAQPMSFRMAYSANEALRNKDFDDMTAAEAVEAREAIRRMRLSLRPVHSRRLRPDLRGSSIDVRRTLRAGLRTAGDAVTLHRRSPSARRPALVTLCDISGSMESYSRTLLHFFHALTNAADRVYTFVFGTRLTNVTRLLRDRDVDRALGRVGRTAQDWYGGTRIGAALDAFNRHWSRRLLSQGAVVLLVTDGLDREGGADIRQQARRLRLSCRRLVWLNPLLRYEDFAPRAAGVRALLPEIDEHRPVHNLVSLASLAEALGRMDERPVAE